MADRWFDAVVNVPAQYDPLIKDMSSGTGIPYAVIAAQAQAESGFNAKAVSSAGAEGWLQFLPTTYDPYAVQVGVPTGSEFNPADEAKVYVAYMSDLLKQEGGNLRDALAAYNAGPGNLSAGYGYADSILSASKTGDITVAQTGGGTSAGLFGIPGLPSLSVSGIITDAINAFLKAIGIGSIKDLWERAGLIILGFALVLVGIKILSEGSGGSQTINVQTSSAETEDEAGARKTTTSRKIKTPVSTHQTTTTKKHAAEGAEKTGAEEAVEAAAVA